MGASPISMPKRKRIRKLRLEGMSYAAIARVVSVSETTAKRHACNVAPRVVSQSGRRTALQTERWYARINSTMAEVRA